MRTAAYKMPTESVRGGSFFARGPERTDRDAPQYEERRPAYASSNTTDYFDTSSRVGGRKDGEYERSSKRTPTQDDRERARGTTTDVKEDERSRQREKAMRREKEINKDRDRKTAYVVEESDTETDEYERHRRRSKGEDDSRRAKPTYYEPARRDREEAARGYYDSDERAHKLYSQYDGAREYMEKALHAKQRPEEDGRPSPMRMSSSRDKLEYIKREGRPSAMIRRGSSRTKPASREPEERRTSPREGERRSSAEIDLPRRAPPLTTAKSSPAEIRLPSEKQRAQSVQIDAQSKADFVPPKFKRSETMPNVQSRERRKEPQKGSSLRQTEIVDGYATPAPTPNVSGSEPSKYKYHQEYEDDYEYPTPDGYRTEVREPTSAVKPRYTRSPSPIRDRERERERDKVRAASARYSAPETQRPAAVPRTTSTSYVYTPTGSVETYARPSLARDSSKIGRSLYGELPTTRETSSPRQPAGRYPPPPESVKYQKDIRPEDIRVQSGYGSRRPSVGTRPSYSRQGSGYSTVYVK